MQYQLVLKTLTDKLKIIFLDLCENITLLI